MVLKSTHVTFRVMLIKLLLITSGVLWADFCLSRGIKESFIEETTLVKAVSSKTVT